MLKLLEAQCLLRAALDFQSFAIVDCSIQSCLVLGDYRYIVIKYVIWLSSTGAVNVCRYV